MSSVSAIPEDKSIAETRAFRASLSEPELAAYNQMVERQSKVISDAVLQVNRRPQDVYKRSAEETIRANWDVLKGKALAELGGLGKAATR